MRKRRITIAVVLLGCVLAGVGLAYQRGKIPDLRVLRADAARHKVDKRVIEADNRFAIKLFKAAVKRSPGKNVVISPPSISMALSMAYNGAVGDTRAAMEKTLEFTGLDAGVVNSSNSALMSVFTHPDRGVSMSVANSVWIDDPQDMIPEFRDLMTSTYRAEVGPLDINAISAWTKSKTRGHIPRAAERLGPMTGTAIANTVTFKGRWCEQFDEDATRQADFRLAGDKVIRVPMMHNKGAYRYLEGRTFDAVRLSYGTGRVSMYVFVPYGDDALGAFCRELDADRIAKWMGDFQEHRKYEVSMPKFEIGCSQMLDEDLKSLGMQTAFHVTKADFSKMRKLGSWIEHVMHKAVVEVDEEGTRAFAVTMIDIGARCATPGICVDRPFLFLIRDDRTGLILFMGAVEDPRG